MIPYWLMPISCHFRDCKALLVTSLTHVSGAIASVQTFYLYLLPEPDYCLQISARIYVTPMPVNVVVVHSPV